MEKIAVRIKKLLPEAKMPTYASPGAAGADLYVLSDHAIRIGPRETAIVHTGLAAEIPAGYVGLICARSGLASKKGLAPANKEGVITHFDCMYDPAFIARKTFAAMKKKRDYVVPGFVAKATHALTKLLPHSFVMRVFLAQQKLK